MKVRRMMLNIFLLIIAMLLVGDMIIKRIRDTFAKMAGRAKEWVNRVVHHFPVTQRIALSPTRRRIFNH